MGIPIPRRARHAPRAAVVALIALGALLVAAAGPVAFWAVQNFRSSNTPPVVQISPLPNPFHSPTPVTSPSPSPSPAQSPSAASVVATLKGKIAISSGQPGSGGWIQFPSGAFTADPKSNVTLPGGMYGQGLSWNALMNTWVPANWYLVRQDGQVYAYVKWDGGMRVWIARSNGATDPLAPLPAGSNSYSLISAEPEGVYVSAQDGQGGLWLLDYTGKIRQVYATGFWQLAAFGYAYGTVTPYVPQGGTNIIIRLNLKTGQTASWFSETNFEARVVGITLAGVPIITTGDGYMVKVWLARAQADAGPLLLYQYTGGQPGSMPYALSALGDQTGIWVAMSNGLYLWTSKAGWEFASPTTGMLASTIQ